MVRRVKPRWRPGLEARHWHHFPSFAQARRALRRVAGAAGLRSCADRRESVRKGRCRWSSTTASSLEPDPELGHNVPPGPPRTISSTACWKTKGWAGFEPAANRGLVEHTVGLRSVARTAVTFARIERPKLDARLVGG